jgi:hypothetical protein
MAAYEKLQERDAELFGVRLFAPSPCFVNPLPPAEIGARLVVLIIAGQFARYNFLRIAWHSKDYQSGAKLPHSKKRRFI